MIREAVAAIVADVKLDRPGLGAAPFLSLAAPGAWLRGPGRPQFEAGRAAVGKGGIVRSVTDRRKSCGKPLADIVEEQGWTVEGVIASPIRGGSGNEEFLNGARLEA